MFTRFHLFVSLIVVVVGLGTLAGCGQVEKGKPAPGKGGSAAEAKDAEYNPHDVPITEEQKANLRKETAQFAAAVAKVKEFRNETEKETENGIPENPYKAHQALDQADLVLGWLPEIARSSGVAKEHWEEVNTTANDLRTLFEKVHQNIDNKKNPDFASVADQIDQKIAKLEGIAQAQPAPAKEG